MAISTFSFALLIIFITTFKTSCYSIVDNSFGENSLPTEPNSKTNVSNFVYIPRSFAASLFGFLVVSLVLVSLALLTDEERIPLAYPPKWFDQVDGYLDALINAPVSEDTIPEETVPGPSTSALESAGPISQQMPTMGELEDTEPHSPIAETYHHDPGHIPEWDSHPNDNAVIDLTHTAPRERKNRSFGKSARFPTGQVGTDHFVPIA